MIFWYYNVVKNNFDLEVSKTLKRYKCNYITSLCKYKPSNLNAYVSTDFLVSLKIYRSYHEKVGNLIDSNMFHGLFTFVITSPLGL